MGKGTGEGAHSIAARQVRVVADSGRFEVATSARRFALTLCTPNIAHLRLLSDGEAAARTYVVREPHDWPRPDASLGTAAGQVLPEAGTAGQPGGKNQPAAVISIDAGSLRVETRTDPATLVFANGRGDPLLRVALEDGVRVETLVDSAPEEGPVPEGGTGGPVRARRRLTVVLQLLGQQHFYGLGEGGKQFDRLGDNRRLWNNHIGHGPGSDIAVPLLLSNRGYGLFFDSAFESCLTLDGTERSTQITYTTEGGQLDCYFLFGGDLRGTMKQVAELLGSAPMPPRWSLGYLQSTRHFDDAAELSRLPRLIREKRIPCDGVILLSTYGDALGWNRGVGHLEFQPGLFPDPAAVLAEYSAQGFRVVTHEYPVLHDQSPLWAEAERRGFLLDDGYDRLSSGEHPSTEFHEGQRYMDFSDAEARRWWWAHHRVLAQIGVAGWWLDGGEGPAPSIEAADRTGVPVHNTFDRDRQRAFAEGEVQDYPDRRAFLLCRSGAAGMQQYGAACWSGDVGNTFPVLEAQIPLGLNTAMSGIPYWGTDIGGFFHPVPESAELYVRWFQFGAFCPVFRSHGWVWREHVPWAHGPEVEEICRRYVELRYRLMPYTYSLARQAHTLGIPLMRPLVLNYPDDPRVWDLGSEYLWGDDLLVAPVTRAGVTSWSAYLPEGGWHDFWTQERHAGACGVSVDAPLDRLPLFARAGAILPLAPPMQFDGELPWDVITMLIYPQGHSTFELYEDDGTSSRYREGRYALTAIACDCRPGTIDVRIGDPVGDAAVLPGNRTYVLQLRTDMPRRVRLNGRELSPVRDRSAAGDACFWHDGLHFTFVRMGSPGGTVTLEY